MLNLKKALTKMLNVLPLFVEVELSGTSPIVNANTYFNFSLSGTIPTGYKPVAIKSINTGTSNLYIHSFSLSNSEVYIAGRSTNSQGTTSNASATVLCMKTLGGVLLNKIYVNLRPLLRKAVVVC